MKRAAAAAVVCTAMCLCPVYADTGITEIDTGSGTVIVQLYMPEMKGAELGEVTLRYIAAAGDKGPALRITGIIENRSRAYMAGAVVTVTGEDGKGQEVARASDKVTPRIIRQRDPAEGRFDITLAYTPEIRACRFDVDWQGKKSGNGEK